MSVTNVVTRECAQRLADLTLGDFEAIVRVGSLGLNPQQILDSVAAVNRGEDPQLPENSGAPKPLKINAWSFLKDHGQFSDTYGMTSAEAGAMLDLLASDADKALADIAALVTAQLRKRGSLRPVVVSREGMPAPRHADAGTPAPGRQGGYELKEEIKRNPTVYGMYHFEAEPTGSVGPQAFRCRLGGGLYSTFPSKKGAVDVAKICRVNGRDHPLCAGRVAFWLQGKPPMYGDYIPEKVTFDGRLAVGVDPPADPAVKAKTEAPSPRESDAGEGSSKPQEGK